MKKLLLFLLSTAALIEGKAVASQECVMPEATFEQGILMKKNTQTLITYQDPKLNSFFENDPYTWLEDASYYDNEVEEGPNKAKIDALVAAENAHFSTFRDQTLEGEIFDALVAREEKAEDSYPHLEKGYHYIWRKLADKAYEVYLRKKVGSSVEEILLDENKIVEENGYSYFSLDGLDVSHDDLLAYAFDADGSEVYNIVIKDLKTNTYLTDVIENVADRIVWHQSLPGFFYTAYINHVPKKLYFHRLGTAQADDVLVFEETNQVKSIAISAPGDERFLCISSGDTDNSVLHVIDLEKVNTGEVNAGQVHVSQNSFTVITVVPESLNSHEVNVSSANGYLYFSTNEGEHVNHQLFRTPFEKAADPTSWELLIPSLPNRMLVDFDVYDNHLAAVFMLLASHELYLYPLDDLSKPKRIAVSDDPCDISIDFEETDTPYLRFNHSSMLSPRAKYEYNFESQLVEKVYQKVVPNYNPADYRSEQMIAKTYDGKDLPISLLYKADRDQTAAPLYVYAYGSYGLSMEPNFTRVALSIADAGFIYAIVHARGGSECGYEWYLDGKMSHKTNTFKDVISGTEALVEHFNIKDASDVVLNGGSAGGLVIGYCANERPDLFGTVIGEVPFVDLVKDMLNTSIPLTMGEWMEWGNPQIEEQFDWMMAYDPIHNVKEQGYPNVLLTAGLTDPRVPYWHPYKFGLKIRAYRSDPDGLTFMHAYDAGGHFGGSGRYEPLKKQACKVAFAIKSVENQRQRSGKQKTVSWKPETT